MIIIATYFEVKPEYSSEGARLLDQYRRSSIGDDGCIRLEALGEIHRRNRFVMIEAWDSEPALAAHEAAGHTVQFRADFTRIQKSPFDQRAHSGFSLSPPPEVAHSAGVFVVTHVDVPPPRRDETEALLKASVDGFRNEPGNGRYDILQQTARPNHFTLVAVWIDDAAFARSESSAHAREFREKLGPMLGALYDERIYRVIG
jgi:quinol monooxygenase YgiN